jgi:UDP-2,3-diacylglucosamine pyrophosphatase LpxH
MDDPKRYRTIFVSDVHLGTSGCQAGMLLEFLKRFDAEVYYLVGDIVDGWRLRKSWHWPQPHNDILQKFLRKVRKGSLIYYIPGNHDEFLRDYVGVNFGGIEIQDRMVHEAADGTRYLVVHGDMFDAVVVHARWLAYLGDWAYEVALSASAGISFIRRKLGLPYWSLSAWAKGRVKTAVSYVGSFEACLAAEARKEEATGVICGHIHQAAIRDMDGVRYINTGDWVESCTAIAERFDGTMELINFAEILRDEAVAMRRRPEQRPLALAS